MNTAQKNLKELMTTLLEAGVPSNHYEFEFLLKCSKAWEGFDDSCYSYPHWQLRALEKEYGLTVAELKKRYDSYRPMKEEILKLHKEQLFKDVLGALMRPEYQEIPSEEMVRIAMGAIGAFAKGEGVNLEWTCLNNHK